MVHGTDKTKHKDGSVYTRPYFICGNYRRSGKTACTTHTIGEDILLPLVIADIREKARAVTFDEKRIAAGITRLKSEESDNRLAGYEQELKAALSRLPETERLMMNLYEDRIKGIVPEAVFSTLMKKYETQQAELAVTIPELKEKIQNGRECFDNIAMWMKHIRKYTKIETVDESILIELVDRIDVSEPQMVDGNRVCDIKIVYRYVGCVDEAVESNLEVPYAKAV